MDGVYSWVKSLIVGYCFLELLSHLIANAQYRRYLRFFGGLVMLFIMLSPAADFFSAGDFFSEALRKAFLEEEAMELAVSQESLADLRNSKISEAYREELTRQMTEIANAYGFAVSSVELGFSEDGLAADLESVEMTVEKQAAEDTDESAQTLRSVQAEICSVYGLSKGKVRISGTD